MVLRVVLMAWLTVTPHRLTRAFPPCLPPPGLDQD